MRQKKQKQPQKKSKSKKIAPHRDGGELLSLGTQKECVILDYILGIKGRCAKYQLLFILTKYTYSVYFIFESSLE